MHITLRKHLAKEETQLLPLLLQHFSFNEQAELVAQFICSIPLQSLDSVLPWIKRSMPLADQAALVQQVYQAVPDRLLGQLMVSWLSPKQVSDQSECELQPDSPTEFTCCGCHHQQPQNNTSLESCRYDVEDLEILPTHLENAESDQQPLHEIFHFHRAIRSAMLSFARETESLQTSLLPFAGNHPSRLTELVESHRFLRAVCLFHATSEDEILFPALHRITGTSSPVHQVDHANETAQFEQLGRLLSDVKECVRRGAKEAAPLTEALVSLAHEVSKAMNCHMAREEQDVLPVLMRSLCKAEQRHMAWRLLRAMPLRLLKQFIPWVAAKLREEDVKQWMRNVRRAASPSDKPLVELLSTWATLRKSSVDIQGDAAPAAAVACCHPAPPLKRIRIERSSIERSSSSLCDADVVAGEGTTPVHTPMSHPSPIDHIFQFHKALRRELRELESSAVELQNAVDSAHDPPKSSEQTAISGIISSLRARFQFLRGIYRAHSSAEDEIVFPALEAKETLHNVSRAYTLDHEQEEALLEEVSEVIEALGALGSLESSLDHLTRLRELASQLARMCAAVRAALETHVKAEEKGLWPLFAEHFSIKEQEHLVGVIIGRTGAEVLKSMLGWVEGSMTEEERIGMMTSIKSATKSTAFEQWLNSDKSVAELGTETGNLEKMKSWQEEQKEILGEVAAYLTATSTTNVKDSQGPDWGLTSDSSLFRPGWSDIFLMNQKQLEAAVRRVSADESLEPDRKAYLIQHLMASKYIVAQQKRMAGSQSKQSIASIATHGSFGCNHYRRGAKLVAPCCGEEYVCRLCHDEAVADHKLDRYAVKEMRCLHCGTKQAVSGECISCGKVLARYYCEICHLFDDDPTHEIYHCPFCNFCRRGKGLGKDAFHCMSCNACMSLELFNKHRCTEAALAGNCPVCSEALFHSSAPIKELPCGHFMHSHCFGAYTRHAYSCPVCFKSLGDMAVYWKMIDSLLASEPGLPPQYAERRQLVRCNDCETETDAPFHFVYHKCGGCGGYNTRVL